MASTDEGLPDGKFKILDENDISYSQTPPDTSTPPDDEWTENEGAGVGSNSTRGVIVAVVPVSREILYDARTGSTSYAVNYSDGSRKIVNDPAMKKIIDKQLMDGLAKGGAAIIQANKEAAAEAANQDKGFGFGLSGEAKLTLPGGYEVFDVENGIGHKRKDTSLSKKFDLTDGVKRTTGTENVPTPGFSIGVTVSVSAERQKKLGMSDEQRAFALKVQEKKKEIQEEYNKAKEKAMKTAKTDPQAANDQLAKDYADLLRKYGKELAEAALK